MVQKREIGGGLAPAGDLLPELYQQRPDLPAVALDHRGEFIALRHLHADPADIHIGDLQSAAAVDQKPIDLDRLAAGARDLAGNRDLVAGRPAADDPERRTAIFAQAGAVGLDQVFREQLQEFLLLRGGGGTPIAAEDELADPGDVEVVPQ